MGDRLGTPGAVGFFLHITAFSCISLLLTLHPCVRVDIFFPMSFGTSGREFQPTSDPHLDAHFMRGPALYEKDYRKDYRRLHTRLYKYLFDSAV